MEMKLLLSNGFLLSTPRSFLLTRPCGATMLGCHIQHELRHSGGGSRPDAMARRIQQGFSAVRVLILVRTEEVGWKVSHDGNKG